MRILHSVLRSVFGSTLAAAMLAGMVSAQTVGGTTFGVLVGGTAARVTDIDVGSADLFNGLSTIKNRFGFQAGAFVNRSFSKVWSLQPEVHYVQKGVVFDVGGSSGIGTVSIDLTYVELPVLLRADLGSAVWHPFISAGPTVALRVGCRGKVETAGSALSVDCNDFDDNGAARDPFETTDFGVSGGVGMVGAVSGRKVLMQLRYGRGFKTVVTDDGSSSGSTLAPKNSVISVVFGFGNR